GWTVENGLLTGRSATAHHLFTERSDFENFHIRAEVRLQDNGNSGIFFRSEYGVSRNGKWPKGYEAQIVNNHPDPKQPRTGSLFIDQVVNRIPDQRVEPGEWCTMDIIAQGRRLIIKVNDRTTVDYVDENNTYKKGYFALQAMGPPATVVQFRKIEVKELPPGDEVPQRSEMFLSQMPFISKK